MEGLPLARLQESLRTGARFVGADYQVGLVSYSSDITVDLPLAPFDDAQHSLFQGAVNSLRAEGGTATNDALLAAMKMLTDAAPKYDNPSLRIFLLSDGETNEGLALDRVASVIDGLNIPVYTIGYNANVEELTAISSMNEAYFTSADSDDVVSKIKELFTAQL
jgi:Ca-activated chloride channel family protein